MSSTRDPETSDQQTTELPPFVFVPEHLGAATVVEPSPVWADDPGPVADPIAGAGGHHDDLLDDPGTAPAPRRWSTGHTVAAAVVAVGVLVSGGAAVAVRNASRGTDAAASQPGQVGQLGGQAPGGQGGLGPGQGGFAPPGQGQVGGIDVHDLRELLARFGVTGQVDSTQLRALLTRLGVSAQVTDSQLQQLLSDLSSGGIGPGGTAQDPGGDDSATSGTGAVHT